MKRPTLILALGNVILLAALVWRAASPSPDSQRDLPTAEQWARAQQEIAQLKEKLRATAAVKPAATPSATLPAVSNAPGPGSAVAPPAMPNASPVAGAALRQMVSDPQVKQLLQRQQEVEVEGTYFRLFEQLQLDPQERAHFKDLLSKRAQHEADVGMQLLDASKTPQQRQQIIEQAAEGQKQFLQTIRAFLNNEEDWARFQRYEGSRRERSQFESQGRSVFAASGGNLSVEQEERLIESLAQQRRNRSSALGASLQRLTQPGGSTPANLQQWEQLQRQANAEILAGAADLNAAQKQALNQYLEQQLQRTLQGLRLGAQLR